MCSSDLSNAAPTRPNTAPAPCARSCSATARGCRPATRLRVIATSAAKPSRPASPNRSEMPGPLCGPSRRFGAPTCPLPQVRAKSSEDISDFCQRGCPVRHFGNILRPASSVITCSVGTSVSRLYPSPNNFAIGCGSPVALFPWQPMAAVRGRLSSLPGLENARVYHLAYSRHPFTW